MLSLRVPTGLQVGEFEDLHLGVEIHGPAAQYPDRACELAFYCLPGGGMQRQFYDLSVPQDDSFSFAQAMGARGFSSVLVDHPGIGGSDQPEDGYALTPELLAQAHGRVLEQLRQRVPALRDTQTVGVGHSMGAMISLLQQARAAQHRGLILLGFGFDGLPQYLPPAAKALLADRAALEAAIPELARAMFQTDYPVIRGGGETADLYAGASADPAGVEAIRPVRTHMLPVPAFASLLPDHWQQYAQVIDVPVLLALGDKDLVKAPDNVAAVFAASPAAEVMVLPQTGHSQFLFSSRTSLFAKIGEWADQLLNQEIYNGNR